MSLMDKLTVLIVGSGSMASTYAQALYLPDSKFELLAVVGRKEFSPMWLDSYTAINYTNDLSKALAVYKVDMVIVAVSESSILDVVIGLKDFKGLILLEKPVGKNLNEYHQISRIAAEHKLRIRVALNRRFYSSVKALRSMCDEKSFLVQDQQGPSEFPKHRLEAIGKRNIPYANSIHLIDTVCFLASAEKYEILEPISIVSSGFYTARVLFNDKQEMTYVLAWDIPGPWAISCYDKNYYSDLRPLERLVVKDADRNVIADIEENGLVKNGLVEMLTEAAKFFKNDGDSSLTTLSNAFLSASLVSELITIKD